MNRMRGYAPKQFLGISTFAFLLALCLVMISAVPVQAQTGFIVLDGKFDDWLGQPNVPDDQGDAQTNHSDLSAFYFANNPDQDFLYFMAERWDLGSEGLDLRLFIDTNNNGNIYEPADRMLEVRYHPNQGGRTYVDLYDGSGVFIKQVAYQMNWGESGKAGKVEWGVTFSDLGIAPYTTIRMQLFSYNGTQVSDSVAEVQWSPANALGWYLLLFSGTIGLGLLYYKRRSMV
jgi:hypothetical protein